MSEITVPHVEPAYPFEAYPHVVEPLSEEGGGGFLTTFPDLPGCMSDGESIEEVAIFHPRSGAPTRFPAPADGRAADFSANLARKWGFSPGGCDNRISTLRPSDLDYEAGGTPALQAYFG